MLIFTQLGFCCAYVIYAGNSLHHLIPSVSHYLFMAMTIPVLVPLAWVRHVGKLGFTR